MSSPTKQIPALEAHGGLWLRWPLPSPPSLSRKPEEEEQDLQGRSQYQVRLARANPQQTPMNRHAAGTMAWQADFAM